MASPAVFEFRLHPIDADNSATTRSTYPMNSLRHAAMDSSVSCSSAPTGWPLD